MEGSRFGILADALHAADLTGIDGLHFHTLCEQNADALVETLEVVERDFGDLLHQMKWLNLGGGHHITRIDYDIDTLIATVRRLRETYGVDVYLEPGEAVVLNAGYLVTSVVDLVHNGMDIAILDTSAACHMPDVIEMPYRPPLENAGEPDEFAHTYRLVDQPAWQATSLEIIPSTNHSPSAIRSFLTTWPLHHGQDQHLQRHASASIYRGCAQTGYQLVREFGYEDFKRRL